jgi:membrane-associated HD superfamily phosphohydrolase
MADLENTPEVVESTAPSPAELFAEEALLPNTDKVAEAIQKARAQEKDKLYPQLNKLQEEIGLLRKEREERLALDAQRAEKRKQREAEREAEKKAQQEEEMSFKKLLKTKEEEWASKLETERTERERAFALLEREREFQELQQYRQQRLEQERDNIIPELIDLISGNTRDEIEQSIAGLKERSAKIFDSVAQVAQQSRKEMTGSRITMPASGPLDNDSDSRMYSPDDISKMSLQDYAKNRSKLIGNSKNSGQGLFG